MCECRIGVGLVTRQGWRWEEVVLVLLLLLPRQASGLVLATPGITKPMSRLRRLSLPPSLQAEGAALGRLELSVCQQALLTPLYDTG